jgi:GT2 family glycosyltransferase
MLSFIELLSFISANGGNFKLSVQYLPIVNASRCKCLGADVMRGKNQVPFGGEIEYDYLMWIDSDVIFTQKQFVELINMNKDIASGWYAQPQISADGSNFTPVTKTAKEEIFNQTGSFEFLTAKDMDDKNKPFKADYIGFGWVLIKKGVFEKLEYPWFAPRMRYMANGVQDLCSEDVAFCIDAKNAGFEIWVNPKCRVGHEKTLII